MSKKNKDDLIPKILTEDPIPLYDGLISCPIDAPRRRVLDAFQKKIEVNFNRIEILNIALTHSSYSRRFWNWRQARTFLKNFLHFRKAN